MLLKKLPYFLLPIWFCIVVSSCNKEDKDPSGRSEIPPIPDLSQLEFRIDGHQIFRNSFPVVYQGVNAMQTFGLTDPSPMNEWGIKIVREFIGNLREQPIDGFPIQGSDGVWYHPLQTIVNQNRANQKITILCPFGWVNDQGNQTLLTGLNPSSQDFFHDYQTKMKLIAEHFKNQPDVWIEVWNEPYHWNNENRYSHELWLKDMSDMVDNLRRVNGFYNIILVPGNEQGQSESAILEKGKQLLKNRYNILFDIHAYEKWLENSDSNKIQERLAELQNMGFAFIIGEVGVLNIGSIMPVDHFLEAAAASQVGVLAWLWNRNSQYPNALLTDEGEPNADQNNNYWGTKFKNFLQQN
ncbi:MAG: cellulase family glycosylhydrolase [Mongoliitalea sp.]